MTNTILVPIDGSEQGYGGLEYSLVSFPDATITALHVIDAGRGRQEVGYDIGVSRSWEQRARDTADRLLNRAREQADRHGIEIRTETTMGDPHREILEHIAVRDVDHVVMGSHGESPITRPFVGRVTEAVVRRAPQSVTVVHETPDELRSRDLPGRILVPIDGQERATAALEYALTQFPDAVECTALHVIDAPFDLTEEQITGTYLEPVLDELREEADEILSAAASNATELDGEIETATAFASPASGIVEYAVEHGMDQIVMGKHGRSTVSRLLLGSVAEAVSQRSPISVTLVDGNGE